MTLVVSNLTGFYSSLEDGNDAFTKLLLHGDGADASTTITDSSASPHTMTAVNNAQIDTAQSKFGDSSILFDGVNDQVTTTASADWNHGTSDLTEDFWIRFNATTRMYIRDLGLNVSTIIITPSSGLVEVYGPASHIINAGSTAFSTGTWYHVAVVRSGNSWVVYRDGVSYATATDSRSWGDSTSTITFGTSGSATFDFSGWLEEYRISNGIARWTADFMPPGRPYT